jgi:hypothetical protein
VIPVKILSTEKKLKKSTGDERTTEGKVLIPAGMINQAGSNRRPYEVVVDVAQVAGVKSSRGGRA